MSGRGRTGRRPARSDARSTRWRAALALCGIVASLLVVVSLLVVAAGVARAEASSADAPRTFDARVPGVARVELAPTPTGDLAYVVRMRDGRRLELTPDGFAALAYAASAPPTFWQRLLNVRTGVGIVWVALGLLAQLAFMSRMLVQWIASERAGHSVVPVGFWWISLAGASMLLAYFAWRRDLVGLLGQSMGFLVYARNLWLIHRGRRPALAD